MMKSPFSDRHLAGLLRRSAQAMGRIPDQSRRLALASWHRVTGLLLDGSGGMSRPRIDLDQITATSWHGHQLPNPRGAKPAEQECLYAIGDIHGRADLLDDLLNKIDADVADLPDGVRTRLIFLGDYIDRGGQSREVIDILLSPRLKGYDPVFLAGNHEDALFRFWEDAQFGADWLLFGGGATLSSYGVMAAGRQPLKRADWAAVWTDLHAAMPADHKAFFKSLKPIYLSGDFAFVHAGLRPGVALPDQSTQDMMWIRESFLDHTEIFPRLVVHGHTPAETPYCDDRRLGLDTGAYATGILTAARLLGTDIRVLATSPAARAAS